MIANTSLRNLCLLVTLCLWMIPLQSSARTLYVRSNAAPNGAGTSWATAFDNPVQALNTARSGDEIWVAAGTYRPTDNNDQSASFQLKKGVTIYGGFAGTETALPQRNYTVNTTILSGDIGRQGQQEDNSMHVVIGATGAVIDGFTIRDGYALGGGPPGGEPQGGQRGAPQGGGRRGDNIQPQNDFMGMQRAGQRGGQGRRGGPPQGGPPQGGAPQGGGQRGGPIHVTPQTIINSSGRGSGAGMLNLKAAPVVRNCIFEENHAGKGGAVYNMVMESFPPPRNGREVQAATFINCTFRNNSGRGRGGAISNDMMTSPVFLNCRFENNVCGQKGGGIYNDFGCSPILINCFMTGNQAQSAAAMGNDGSSAPILYYCTLTDNRAEDYGAGLYQGTGPANNPIVLNSIIWGNQCEWGAADMYNWHDNSPLVESSIIAGGFPGSDNRDTNPRIGANGVASDVAGYRGDDARFTESSLPELLASLKSRRPQQAMVRNPVDRNAPAATAQNVRSSDRIVYVNRAARRSGDGASWQSAYADLNAALTDAASDGAQIWIAAGIYTPVGDGRNATFQFADGVQLFGGFTGIETKQQQRDIQANRTILSGDIGIQNVATDNSFHVVIGANGAVLDGVTIQDGYADGLAYDGKGGGLINYKRAPQGRPGGPNITGYSITVRQCIFQNNFARDGGALYNYDRGAPKFIACTFRKNRADYGGSLVDCVGVESTYEDCLFDGNSARYQGGAAIFDYGARSNLSGTRFTDNTAGSHGGAVFSASRASQLENTTMTFTNCRFESNASKGDGGAINFHDSSLATVNNCTFTNNAAGRNGGAMAVTMRSIADQASNEMNGNRANGDGPDVYEE